MNCTSRPCRPRPVAIGALVLALVPSGRAAQADAPSLDFSPQGVAELRFNADRDGLSRTTDVSDTELAYAFAVYGRINDVLGVLGGTFETEVAVDGRHSFTDDRVDDPEVRLNEAFFTRNAGDFTFSLGRKEVRWGVGYVSSPTDIISAAANPIDPDDRFFTLEGRTVAGLAYVGEASSVDVLAVLADDDANALNENALASRFYHNIGGLDLSLIGGIEDNGEYIVGANTAVTIGSALELHGDVVYDSDALSREIAFGPGGVPSLTRDSSVRALTGGQWTSPNDINFVLEYLYFSDGLDNGELRALIRSGALEALAGDSVAGFGTTPLQTHYAFARVAKDEVFANIDIEWIAFKSLENSGYFQRLQFMMDIGENFEAYLDLVDVGGGSTTEFGQSPFDTSIRLGFTFTF